MKKISLCTLWVMLSLCLALNSRAQGNGTFIKFFVTITDPSYEPVVTVYAGGGITVNFAIPAVDSIASNYTFRQFHRAFPNTQNTALEDVFIVEVDFITFMHDLANFNEGKFANTHEAVFSRYYVTIADSTFAPSYVYDNYVSTVTFAQQDLNDLAADYSFTAFGRAFPNSTDPAQANIYLVGVHSYDFIQGLLDYSGSVFTEAAAYQNAKIRVYITDRNYLPAISTGIYGEKVLTFQQSGVQSIFNKYNVTQFRQMFPESYFQDLRNIYFIECSSFDLISDLTSYDYSIFPGGSVQPEIEPMITPNEYPGQYLSSFAPQNRHHNWLELINAPTAWDITTNWSANNDSIRIGISDWYVHTRHNEIKPFRTTGTKIYDEGWNSPNYTYPGKEYHGTAIAGIMAGASNNSMGLASIGWDSKVGIRPHLYADSAPNNLFLFAKEGYRAVNCSWNWGECMLSTQNENINAFYGMVQGAEEFYSEMYERGMSCVFGSGNGGDSASNPLLCNYTSFKFPASFDHNISVTSVGSDLNVAYVDSVMPPAIPGYHRSIKDVHDHVIYDTLGKVRPGVFGGPHTHNNNTRVDIAAPGYTVHVLSHDHTDLTKNDLYLANLSGTSAAAPQVTGTIGLMLSTNPCLTPYQVEYLLKEYSEKSIYNISHNQKYDNPKQLGSGRLDAGRSVEEAVDLDCNDSATSTMYIEEIKINHRCWGSQNATLTPIINNGNGNYKYRWKGISGNTVNLNNEYVANPTITAPQSGQVLYYMLTVTEQGTDIPKVAKKRIRVERKASGWDVAMRDGYGDFYNEPNYMDTIDTRDYDFFNSPDIWNSLTDTGTTHQNPEYSANNDSNYLRIRIRNVGCTASPSNTPQLKLYWTIASTGEKWPGDWTTNTMNVPGGTMPTGGDLTTSTVYIPALAVGEETIITIPWMPPNPEDYTSDPDKQLPVCVLARVLDGPSSPYGLDEQTAPTPGHLRYNLRENNNIVTRNMVVVDFENNLRARMFRTFVGNSRSTTAAVSLQMQSYRNLRPFLSGDLSAYMYGVLHLGSIYDAWVTGGSQGNAVVLDAGAKTVLYDPSSLLRLDNISLAGNAMVPIDIEFKLRDNIDVPSEVRDMQIYFNQLEMIVPAGEEFEKEHVTGGLTFSINIATMSSTDGNKPGRPNNVSAVKSSENYVKAYPNPGKEQVTFEYDFSEVQVGLQLVITNITGQTVRTIDINNGRKGSVKWDTGDNPSGVYLYKLLDGNTSVDVGRVVLTK